MKIKFLIGVAFLAMIGVSVLALATDMPVLTVGSIKSGPKTYIKQTMVATVATAVNGTTGYIDVLPANAVLIGAKVSVTTACNGTSQQVVLGSDSNSTMYGTWTAGALNATGVSNMTPNANYGSVTTTSRKVKYTYTATDGGAGRFFLTVDYLR